MSHVTTRRVCDCTVYYVSYVTCDIHCQIWEILTHHTKHTNQEHTMHHFVGEFDCPEYAGRYTGLNPNLEFQRAVTIIMIPSNVSERDLSCLHVNPTFHWALICHFSALDHSMWAFIHSQNYLANTFISQI